MSWIPVETTKHSLWLRWLILRRSEEALKVLTGVHLVTISLATADQVLAFACSIPLPWPSPGEALALLEAVDPEALFGGEHVAGGDDEIDLDLDLFDVEESETISSFESHECCQFRGLHELLPLRTAFAIERNMSPVPLRFPEQTVSVLISAHISRARIPAFCSHLKASIEAEEDRLRQRGQHRRRLVRLNKWPKKHPTGKSPLRQVTLAKEVGEMGDAWGSLACPDFTPSVFSGYFEGAPEVDLETVKW
ncbi:hypothetical protein LIA77_03505 [Sarocladium implicatum]|nr:hypothetical protein LIA77_03505 [Sarocladium implicatum]